MLLTPIQHWGEDSLFTELASMIIHWLCGQAKAYTTRVGAGPYPTEISGDLAEQLREAGAEYGTTTGRPRRVGWLDIPSLKFAARCELWAVSVCRSRCAAPRNLCKTEA